MVLHGECFQVLRTGNHVRVVGGPRQNRERVVGGPYGSMSNLQDRSGRAVLPVPSSEPDWLSRQTSSLERAAAPARVPVLDWVRAQEPAPVTAQELAAALATARGLVTAQAIRSPSDSLRRSSARLDCFRIPPQKLIGRSTVRPCESVAYARYTSAGHTAPCVPIQLSNARDCGWGTSAAQFLAHQQYGRVGSVLPVSSRTVEADSDGR